GVVSQTLRQCPDRALDRELAPRCLDGFRAQRGLRFAGRPQVRPWGVVRSTRRMPTKDASGQGHGIAAGGAAPIIILVTRTRRQPQGITAMTDSGSITRCIVLLKQGDPDAAQAIWDRYFE